MVFELIVMSCLDDHAPEFEHFGPPASELAAVPAPNVAGCCKFTAMPFEDVGGDGQTINYGIGCVGQLPLAIPPVAPSSRPFPRISC